MDDTTHVVTIADPLLQCSIEVEITSTGKPHISCKVYHRAEDAEAADTEAMARAVILYRKLLKELSA